MSGTSEDGVDLCFSNYYVENGRWKFEIIRAETIAYETEELELLKWAYAGKGTNISKFDAQFGEVLSKKLGTFLSCYELKPDFVCSHGHTIFHRPDDGVTVQIGNGQIMANTCRIPVVNNFRELDVKLGGQGAPLVPIGDELLFKKYGACLNLGGFSNISFEMNGRIAFDISPANLPLNKIMRESFNQNFDESGNIARSGNVDSQLLEELNNLDFYNEAPPKSLGVEWLKGNFYPILENYKEIDAKDSLATIVEHIAIKIGKTLELKEASKVLVTGGGARNIFLVERIQGHTKTEVIIPSNDLIDFKEAVVFGLLGILKVRGENNTLKSVTGASQDSCGGDLYLPH